MIFNRIMQDRRNRHILGHRNGRMAVLAHDQRSNSQQVRHRWNVASLSSLDVEVARVVDSGGELLNLKQTVIIFLHGLFPL